MQQTVFKRKFFILLDAVKSENIQHLEEKIEPIKNIVIENIQKKIVSNLSFKKYRLIFEKKKISSRTPYSISIPNLVPIGIPI